MDDVIFAHKLRLVDVAARLRQRGSHAGLGLARRNIHPLQTADARDYFFQNCSLVQFMCCQPHFNVRLHTYTGLYRFRDIWHPRIGLLKRDSGEGRIKGLFSVIVR